MVSGVSQAFDTMDFDSPPRRMGRYELLFRIASGGMAEVFAARAIGEAGFQKLVAVKRMLPTLAEDPEFVQMFLDEARVAANISNAHVVQTLDLGRDNTGALYIVMDLVVGVTLSRIQKEAAKVRRAVPVGMAVELLAQAATGLHAAHEATTPVGEPLHIVHRDVSPQNILVGVDGRVRITDFGVARAVAQATQTQAGRIKGKFAYCSPEQLVGRDVDRRADVFALGVVAWETLAGQRLFVADHPMAIMERVQNMPILPVHQVRSRVPESVALVIDKALQRRRDARFETASELASALRDAARAAGVAIPEQAERRRFVQGAGGEPLRKIRANINAALSSDPAAITDEEPTEMLSGISQSHTMDTNLERLGEESSVPDADASAVVAGPGSLFPQAIAPEQPQVPRRSRRWLAIPIGLGIGVAVAIGVALALRAPDASPDLVPRPEPPAYPGAAEPGLGEGPDVAEEPVPAVIPTEPAADSDPPLALEEPATVEEAEAPPAPEPRPAAASRPASSTGRRSPAIRRVEPPPAPVAMEAPPPPPPEEAPAPPQPPSMRGSVLLGLDDFDRAAGE